MPVTTRPSTATKKVAQVVLDAKQKRRTPAQVREDNARIQKEKDEQEAKAQKSIERVAVALANQQNSAVSSKKPRPRPVPRGRAAAANTPSVNGTSESSVIPTVAQGRGGGKLGGQGQGQVVAPEEMLDNDGDGLEGMVQGKRKRIQKTAHRDAVDTARAVLQVASQSAVDVIKSSHDTVEKGKTSKYVP
jgi:hypothetical protein